MTLLLADMEVPASIINRPPNAQNSPDRKNDSHNSWTILWAAWNSGCSFRVIPRTCCDKSVIEMSSRDQSLPKYRVLCQKWCAYRVSEETVMSNTRLQNRLAALQQIRLTCGLLWYWRNDRRKDGVVKRGDNNRKQLSLIDYNRSWYSCLDRGVARGGHTRQ